MNKAVIGLGFGDEGKGVVTEYLCSQDPTNTIVIRFSGGPQAGHKVIKEKIEHIFSSFGAGTLSGCPTYWSEYCTFEPISFLNELNILKAKNINPKIYLHPNCAVTTCYDMYPDLDSEEFKHGTTGHGIFQTKKRHKQISFKIIDILHNSLETIYQKIEEIRKYYNVEKYNMDGYLDALNTIRSLVRKSIFLRHNLPHYKHNVFEGSQGLMLDEHIGTMPHCTPSDITPRNAMKMVDLNEIFLVTRAYQTRHGNGPMTNEKYPIQLINNEKETCVFNKWQGEFRCTILDLDQLIHAKKQGIDKIINNNTKVNLVITCMDQLSEFKVTHGGITITTHNAKLFAELLGDTLKVNKIYTNTSPFSTTIAPIA